MKKDEKNDTPQRILGRRMARELTREELEQANGGAVFGPVRTYTLTYPADNDPTGGGPIWV